MGKLDELKHLALETEQVELRRELNTLVAERQFMEAALAIRERTFSTDEQLRVYVERLREAQSELYRHLHTEAEREPHDLVFEQTLLVATACRRGAKRRGRMRRATPLPTSALQGAKGHPGDK